MRNIYLALIRQRDHVAFFLAVLISFSLILSNNTQDIVILQGKANDIFSFLYKPVARLRSMAVVEVEAAVLREKNIQLKLQIESMLNLVAENEQLKNLLKYKRESQLTLLPAKVINKGLTSNLSTITIDVGSNQGVGLYSSVLTPNGVIGKTVAVGKYSSIVQVISDVNFRLSVQVLPSGARGILRWVYGDLCEIREVQKSSETFQEKFRKAQEKFRKAQEKFRKSLEKFRKAQKKFRKSSGKEVQNFCSEVHLKNFHHGRRSSHLEKNHDLPAQMGVWRQL